MSLGNVRWAVPTHTRRPQSRISIPLGGLTPSVLTHYQFLDGAVPGSYTVTGSPVAYELLASPGSYTLTGVLAFLDSSEAAEPGDFDVTGTAATLAHDGKFVNAETGTVAVTGVAATVGRGDLAGSDFAANGAFTFTGVETTLEVGTVQATVLQAKPAHSRKPLALTSRVFHALEPAAESEGVFSLDCQPASYTVTGSDATVARTIPFTAARAEFRVRAGAANSIPNGGFEVNTAGWESYSSATLTRVSYASASLPALHDSFVMQVDSLGASSGAVFGDVPAEMISVTPNTQYVYSVWFYSTTAFNPNLAWNEYTAGGTLVGGSATGALVPANIWTEIFLTSTLGATTDLLHLFAYTPLAPAVTFYMDGATLARGSLPTLFNNETVLLAGIGAYALDAAPATYTLTGFATDMTVVGSAGGPRDTAIRAIQAHTPKKRQLVSRTWSALTAETASPSLHAENGTYAITGVDATLEAAAKSVNAEPGVFAVTGSNNDLVYSGFVAPVIRTAIRAVTSHSRKPLRRASRLFQASRFVFSLDCEPGSFVVSPGTNLVANPSFEVDQSGWTAVSHSRLFYDDEHLQDFIGQFLDKVTYSALTPGITLTQAARPAVARNTEYVLSAWVYAEEPWTAFITYFEYDSAHLLLGFAQNALSCAAFQWNQIQSTFTTGNRTAYVGIEVKSNTIEPFIYVDGVELKRGNIASHQALLLVESPAPPGVYSLTGFDTDLFWSGAPAIVFNRVVSPTYAVERHQITQGSRVFYGDENAEAGPTAYLLDCQPATYTLSGVAATLSYAKSLNAVSTSYTVTGVANEMEVFSGGYSLNCENGVYAVTGVEALLVGAGATLSADPATFAVTGVAASVLRDRPFVALPGSYTLTGVLSIGGGNRILSADSTAYTLTGRAATLRYAVLFIDDHPGDNVLTLTDHSVPDDLELIDH